MKNKNVSRVADTNGANTRLTGSWLVIARTIWLVLVIPSVVLLVASFPVYYRQLQTLCSSNACSNLNGVLTSEMLQALHSNGLSASEYAALLTIFYMIIAATWCGIGFLIFWHRSNDWLALLAAFVLVTYNISFTGNPPYALALTYPVLAFPLSLLSFLGTVSVGVFFLLFPNGRFTPRWVRLILLFVIPQAFFSSFPSPTSNFELNWPIWGYGLAALVIYGTIVYSQIYRYRRVSTFVQRQQTKWIVLGITAAIGIVLLFLGVFVVIPSLGNSLLFNEAWNFIIPCAFLLIPLSFGFSILRYRLYDIDLLINRTLVYSALTILLALVYFGLIFGLQYLLRGIISQNNDVAIVISTLAIAALFQPLRHRIQRIIDRRFYRRKYDAAKVVEAFSATLRNEVDLNQLSEHLIAVVQDTMQPAHVSLWLRKSGKERKLDTDMLKENF
ncbi:MAG TPA: hypothetical protein VED37_16010 [Ktedonobacteraceae bacterium]|nr:hypothetical protein [Ktedonobacteraceae bacterium]